MGLEQFFGHHGVEQQLFPQLEELGIPEWKYRQDINGVTQQLIDAGVVLTPQEHYDARDQWRHIIDMYYGMRSDQHVILPDTLFAKGTQPRHGRLLKSRYDGSRNVQQRLQNRLRTVGLDDLLVGYDYRGGYTEMRYKVSRLVDAVRAHILYNQHGKESVSTYTALESPQHGVTAVVENIPSINVADLVHTVTLHSLLPASRVKESYDLWAEHTCERQTWDVYPVRRGEGRIGSEEQYDHHVVYAMLAVQKRLPFTVASPFYRPHRDDYSFYHLMRKNTLVESVRDGHVRRRPLILAEMETMLWKLVGYRNEISEKRRMPVTTFAA